MTSWWLACLLTVLVAVFAGLVWVGYELYTARTSDSKHSKKTIKDLNKAYSDIAEEDIDHLFNKQFREELRNRGRLRFEKIISENAMFLKQDLDLTISQLNEYMKKEITKSLEAEFVEYARAMNDAQQLALAALRKTAEEVEEQRLALTKALKSDVAEREESLLKVYEDNMSQIVEHYVLLALGDQIDLKTQLPYIIEQMELNKKNIIEDMRL